MSNELFSVFQYFDNDTQEQVRANVSAEEAVKAFNHYTCSVAARRGMTKRVIVIDQFDCTNMEWIYGQGVTFPANTQEPEATL